MQHFKKPAYWCRSLGWVSRLWKMALEKQMTFESSSGRKLRLLVAICSYGRQNLGFLNRIIQTYQSLPLDVDIVVLSEAPKDLGSSVRVIVGLPSSNPWSLPFGHKRMFAENLERYDLFAYSEDDIEFTTDNLAAFLKITPDLAPDEIAGFLHYEQDQSGAIWMVCAHRHFHWKADSVRRRGNQWVAEFTNEHSGFYILTQDQMRSAIASGGFLRGPCEGKYDMLCTAATDPYTMCGFRKVICISKLSDFLIHHLPDKYIDKLIVTLAGFQEQVQTLIEIGEGRLPASTLLSVQSRIGQFAWLKSYYEDASEELLKLVPPRARTALSVGCGWGAIETELVRRGVRVTALPLDSVIGSVAARKGIETIFGTLYDCLTRLSDRRFDCVLMFNLLHLLPDPGQILEQCASLVGEGGVLVISGPNFNRLPWRIKRILGIGEFRKLRSFEMGGISCCGPRSLSSRVRSSGMQMASVHWLNHDVSRPRVNGTRLRFGSATARDWAMQAVRPPCG